MSSVPQRCGWVTDSPLYIEYHDHEWGIPVHDDTHLFEMLILEGAQAGLSWITVLKKRPAYREQFHQFDIDRCAQLTDADLEDALTNPKLIRNRLKIYSVRQNARAALALIAEHGSLDAYFWKSVNHSPIVNQFSSLAEIPALTPLSERISKDLKKRGFTFVGPTIIYAFMQAIGMVNDHTTDCFCYRSERSSK